MKTGITFFLFASLIAVPIAAAERGTQTEENWSTLMNNVKSVQAISTAQNMRIDQMERCHALKMFYAPGVSGADPQGCLTDDRPTLPQVATCATNGMFYNPTTNACIPARKPVWTEVPRPNPASKVSKREWEGRVQSMYPGIHIIWGDFIIEDGRYSKTSFYVNEPYVDDTPQLISMQQRGAPCSAVGSSLAYLELIIPTTKGLISEGSTQINAVILRCQ